MEEDSKWRSEEEEGEEEKGLMAFPLIAPLPTFVPTLHPHSQPHAPTQLSRRGPCGPGTQFPSTVGAWGWGHGPQGLVASRPTLAMSLYGQSTLGTLTWGEGDACVRSVRWGCDGPQTPPPHPAPTQKGLRSPPPELRRGDWCSWMLGKTVQVIAASTQQPLRAKG